MAKFFQINSTSVINLDLVYEISSPKDHIFPGESKNSICIRVTFSDGKEKFYREIENDNYVDEKWAEIEDLSDVRLHQEH